MFLKHVRDIAKPQHFAIIDLLKRSTGMPVGELSRALDMSYMGVKQHCLELEKKGWLATWRRSIPNGRPEKLYRLTSKGDSLFPEAGSEVMLEMLKSLSEIFGSSAVEKLLFSYFQKKLPVFDKKLKGGTPAEKAAQLVRLRSAEGHCAELEITPDCKLTMVEWHNPHHAIADNYPSFTRLEDQMLQRLLGTTVQREEQRVSGLTRIVFNLPALSPSDITHFMNAHEGSRIKPTRPKPLTQPVPFVESEKAPEEIALAPIPVSPVAEAEPEFEAVIELASDESTEAPVPEASVVFHADAPLPSVSRSMRPDEDLVASPDPEPPMILRFTVQPELALDILSN